MGRIRLGFNCNCFTNRYDEPEEWTRLCQDMGVRAVMFNVDLIDPYWGWDLQRRLCDETLNACARRDIKIVCGFGGRNHHQHYLGHPDPECRREGERFFRAAIRQTAYLGGKSFGTCFAIQSVRANADPARRARILQDAIAAYHRLAEYGKEMGLKALSYEMTSVERETCATFLENDFVLSCCADMAVPMRVCLDVGHRNLRGTPEEQDPLAWIRRYGAVSDVIDCHQSPPGASAHWPFTPEFNKQGVIEGGAVARAIEESGADDILLALEINTAAFYPAEDNFMSNMEVSVAYWRQWIGE